MFYAILQSVAYNIFHHLFHNFYCNFHGSFRFLTCNVNARAIKDNEVDEWLASGSFDRFALEIVLEGIGRLLSNVKSVYDHRERHVPN